MYKIIQQKFLVERIICALVVIQLASFVRLAIFFLENHYLPQPFFKDKYDTFMDFFNPLYWATNEGRYTEWGSIYPPLVFLFFKFLNYQFINSNNFYDAYEIRREFPALVSCYLSLSVFSLAAVFFISPLYKNYSLLLRACFFTIYALSAPALFAIERGNVIVFCIPLLAMMVRSPEWLQLVALAALINIKPYFVLLVAAYLYKNNFLMALRIGLLSGIIFIITGLLLDNNFLLFFNSILNFSGSNFPFSPDNFSGVVSSITAFAYMEDWRLANDAAEPLWRLDLAALISLLIRKINFMIEVAILVFLYIKRKDFSLEEIISVFCVILTTLSYSFGGYIILIYAVVAPILICWQRGRQIICLVALLFLPIDHLPIVSSHLDYAALWYSGESKFIMQEWGLGSLLRPCLNELLLIFVFGEVMRRRPVISREASLCRPWSGLTSKWSKNLTAREIIL